MEKTLLVMAAGMGSRFGGLKQIEPMGPNDEFIIDYSVYDALRAGFTKIVFVIKEELYDVFKETIGSRVESHIKVEYAFQKLENTPIKVDVPREKPWGTGQAILAAKDFIHEPFAVINSDDFYGADAYIQASKFLDNISDEKFGLVGYEAQNTITENGAVKRGILEIKDNMLVSIEESSIEKEDDHIHCTALADNHEFDVTPDTLVSMNMLLFTPKIFDYLDEGFVKFLNTMKDPMKDEFLIPMVLGERINSGDISVRIISTIAKWYGVTYKEDKDSVKTAISNMIASGEYPNNLWS